MAHVAFDWSLRHCSGSHTFGLNAWRWCSTSRYVFVTRQLLSIQSGVRMLQHTRQRGKMYQPIGGVRASPLPAWKSIAGVSGKGNLKALLSSFHIKHPAAPLPRVHACLIVCVCGLQVYLPSLLAFVVLDGIWIGLVASDFYMSR
jgi:hypothetical protein